MWPISMGMPPVKEFSCRVKATRTFIKVRRLLHKIESSHRSRESFHKQEDIIRYCAGPAGYGKATTDLGYKCATFFAATDPSPNNDTEMQRVTQQSLADKKKSIAKQMHLA